MVEIEPYGAEYEQIFDDFIAVGTQICYYTWTYEAYYENDLIEHSKISDYVKFDPDLRKFTFRSTNGGKSYNIKIVGDLTDPFTTKELEFTLTVLPAIVDTAVNNKAPSITLKESYEVERQVDENKVPLKEEGEIVFIGLITDKEGDEYTSELEL